MLLATYGDVNIIFSGVIDAIRSLREAGGSCLEHHHMDGKLYASLDVEGLKVGKLLASFNQSLSMLST